ncbi:MAG TPA: stage III sporulation protein AE [Candidatus Limiplasma stercoravium]|nr:stage III sporulation protein AE [Candidatus Limiplasma stercoravium]
MKAAVLLCLALALMPLPALAMEQAVVEGIAQLDLEALEKAAQESGFVSGDVPSLLARLASGQAVLSGSETLAWLTSRLSGVFERSLWRLTRLMAPALLVAVAQNLALGERAAVRAARAAGLVLVAAFLVSDLNEHVALVRQTVNDMAGIMQAVFPLLVTLLAAVGGTTSSAFYQPAVMAAAGSMTTLVEHVTLPFAVSVATLTMVGALSDGLRVRRLCRLLRQVANWTLGLGFTVFIGVMTVQGLGSAAVDGVSIRTAKYAMDHFIPIVGGMFADTVDTLVGCSLLIHNAVGTLGLLMLLGALLLPLLRTALTLLCYRAAGALLEPLGDEPLGRALGDYGDVFSLLFIIELSVGAMFLLLVAQLMSVGNLTVMLR